jgi:hypothetical protein
MPGPIPPLMTEREGDKEYYRQALERIKHEMVEATRLARKIGEPVDRDADLLTGLCGAKVKLLYDIAVMLHEIK